LYMTLCQRLLLSLLLAFTFGARLSVAHSGMSLHCGPTSIVQTDHVHILSGSPLTVDEDCSDGAEHAVCVSPCLGWSSALSAQWNAPDFDHVINAWIGFDLDDYLDFFPPVDPRPPKNLV
jgi:hypothetical protein